MLLPSVVAYIINCFDMKLLQEKLSQYTLPQEYKKLGVYPYFRPIASEQGDEVIINGKKVLMFGSNSYLGLTNDPRVKEAAPVVPAPVS